jgi:hypothetical protein
LARGPSEKPIVITIIFSVVLDDAARHLWGEGDSP